MLQHLIVTKIEDVFTVFSPKGRFASIQNRPCYALSFCTDGQISYTHRGKTIVSDKNHAVLLPQNQSYILTGDKTGTFPVIDFTCNDFLCDTVVPLRIQNVNAYLKDFQKIQSLFLFKNNNAEVLSIFYHMIHRLSQQNSSCRTILPAVQYLENNFQNPNLTNAHLARQCNVSEVYFRKMFTAHYHITPKQFVIDIRINKAKQLLADGSLKINAVAALCGFSNQYHFCRVFKSKTGLTPTDYMNQNRIVQI